MSEQRPTKEKRRYQFIWWGLGMWYPPKLIRYNGGLARIYRWSLLFGPIEVRRWA